MTAIILAGGKSSRMGFDKAFIELEGTTLINKQLKLLRSSFKEVIIVTNNPHGYRFGGIKVIHDVMPACGPLGGIYSGLIASNSIYNFVAACDMPFINPGLIKYMYRKLRKYDIVVPKINNLYEPLFCIYSKSCIKYIKQLLDKKVFKIVELFSKVKVKEISEAEVLRYAPPEEIFMNINTPEDLIIISNG